MCVLSCVHVHLSLSYFLWMRGTLLSYPLLLEKATSTTGKGWLIPSLNRLWLFITWICGEWPQPLTSSFRAFPIPYSRSQNIGTQPRKCHKAAFWHGSYSSEFFYVVHLHVKQENWVFHMLAFWNLLVTIGLSVESNFWFRIFPAKGLSVSVFVGFYFICPANEVKIFLANCFFCAPPWVVVEAQ